MSRDGLDLVIPAVAIISDGGGSAGDGGGGIIILLLLAGLKPLPLRVGRRLGHNNLEDVLVQASAQQQQWSSVKDGWGRCATQQQKLSANECLVLVVALSRSFTIF